jgi:hypothetical protein
MPTRCTDIITRLGWDGHNGVARHDGVTVDLKAAPKLGTLHIREIDFAPCLRISMVRESSQAWRAMSMAERDLAQTLVQTIADAAHAVVA